jgi:hypothetical protein
MATTDPRPVHDDDALTADDRAAIDRALAEPGITLIADNLAELLTGLDDEVRELIAAGRLAEGLAVARFNAFEARHDWNEGHRLPSRQRAARRLRRLGEGLRPCAGWGSPTRRCSVQHRHYRSRQIAQLHPITIGNKRADAPQPDDVYIGRPSPLGNPFVLGRDGDRAVVIARYRTCLQEQLAAGPGNSAYAELHRLLTVARRRPLRLVCWCAPLPCHGDVIMELLRELAGETA